jgi:hypothetical protein
LNRIEFSDFPKYKEKTIFGQLPILEITDENGTVVKFIFLLMFILFPLYCELFS